MNSFRKKSKLILLTLILVSGLLISYGGGLLVKAGSAWTFVDGGLSTGLNFDITKNAENPVIESITGELYAAWEEENGMSSRILFKKYSESSGWAPGYFLSEPGKNAHKPALIVFNNNLYAAWSESFSSSCQIRVSKKIGMESWISIDNGGLVHSRTNTLAADPVFAVYNGNLYLAWTEEYNSTNHIYVYRYNSNSFSWTNVSGNDGINYGSNPANSPNLAVFQNELYAAWSEENAGTQQIRVRKYIEGGSWTFADGGAASGLNRAPSQNASNPKLIVFQNSLYAAWQETDVNGISQIHLIKSSDGISWISIAGGSLNRSQTANAFNPRLAASGNKLYITWNEEAQDSARVPQVRVKQYDGAGFSWIDGGSVSSLLNKDSAQKAFNAFPGISNDDLYVTWSETLPQNQSLETPNQIRLKKLALPAYVTSVTGPGAGAYPVGHTLQYKVNFNKTVAVTGGTPSIPITLSTGKTVNALYMSGSGTKELIFAYLISNGSLQINGIDAGAKINLNSSSIRDTANYLDAELNLNNFAGVTEPPLGVDGLAPTLVSAVRTNNTRITITLSESCVNLTNANDGGFTVSETGNPGITYAVTATALGVDTSHVVLTVANLAVSGKEGVTIKYTAGGNGIIQDAGGSPMATDSVGLSIAPWDTIAPTITSGALAVSNGYIDVSFNEGLYGSADGVTPVSAAGLSLTFTQNGGTATSAVISSVRKNDNTAEGAASALTGAETVIRVFISITGAPKGVETIEIRPANSTSIYDRAGNAVSASQTTGVKTLNDGLAPTFVSAVRVANTKIRVTLSEYCASLVKANDGGFTVAETGNPGIIYNVTSTAQGTDAGLVELTVANMAVSGKEGVTVTYTIGANGTVQDLAGNMMATDSVGVTVVPWDTTSPTITSGVLEANNGYIDIVFNEGGYGASDGATPLSAANLLLTFTANGGNAASAVISSVRKNDSAVEVSASALTGGETTVRVFLSITGIPSGVETIAITPADGSSVFDRAGNAVLASQTTGVKTLNDRLAPAMVSASRTNNTTLVVTLSENCANLAKANNGGFTVQEVGTTRTWAVSATTQGVDASHVVLTVINMAKSGMEGVTITYTAGGNGTIQDTAGNAMATDAVGVTVAPWDTTAPAITSATLDSSNGFVDIVFSEGAFTSVNGSSGLSAADFLLNFNANGGNATNAVISSVKKNNSAVEASASALIGGETTVRVFLSITDLPSGVETVEILPADGASIFDKAGNGVLASETSGVKVLNHKLPPSLVSAEWTDNTHLTVTLSEDAINLTKANDGGFTVNETGNESITYAVSAIAQGADASHLVLTMANLAVSGKEGVTIKYTAGTNGTIQDSLGNLMVTNTAGVSVSPWETTAPTLVSVTRTNNITLTVAFSENCVNLANANNGGFTVTETGTATTYGVTATAMGADASHIVLTIANMAVSGKEGVTVTYTAGGTGVIQDIAGNALETDGVGVIVAPWDTTVPTITSGALDPNNGYVDIVFSKGIYSADNGMTGLTAADFLLNFAANGGNTTNVVISSVKKNDNTVEASATALVGGETTVRVFLSITGLPSGVETVEILPADGAAIFDRAGNPVSASDTTGTKILNHKLPPTLVSAERTDNTHLTVTLSEDSINLTKANDGGFRIVETGNTAVKYTVSAIAQGVDASHVVLTVANLAVSGKEGVTIKYTAGTTGTIQDNAGNAMVNNGTGVVVSPWETTAPTLVSAVRNNNVSLTVAFSEDCANLANANNGGFTVTETGTAITYAVTATAMGVDASHIVLTVANMSISGKEGVTITYTAGGNGIIQDIAGNALETDGVGVVVAPWDTAAPTITSGTLDANNGYVDIVFSEGIYSADNGTTGLTAADFLLNFAANGGNTTNVVISSVKKNNSAIEASASALTGGETTVRAFLSITGLPSGVETVEILPADGAAIFDRAGNPVSASDTTGAKILNHKLPTSLVSAEWTDNTHLTVTLSEDSVNLIKINDGGFTVEETGSPARTYAVSATAQGADASHVVLTVANMLVSGKEGVTVKYTAGVNGTIQDNAGNAMFTNTTGVLVAPWDTTAPTLVSAERTRNTVLTVTLSEDCVNLLNANNGGFTVEETGNPGQTYAVTATRQGPSANIMKLTIMNMAVSGLEGVTVKYTAGGNGIIQDVAGNALDTDSIGVVVAPWDTIAPTITSATLDGNNGYMDIVFSKPVFSANNGTTALTPADFLLNFAANGGNTTNVAISSVKKNNSAVEGTALPLTGAETTVRVFLSITDLPSGVETVEILPADGAAIFDRAGSPVSTSNTTGAKILNHKLPPSLVSAEWTDNTHLTVTLSEDSINLTKANDGGFIVAETGSPATTYAVSAIAQGADASHVVLTVANMLVSGKEGVTVKYTAGVNGTIQDNAANVMVSNSTGVTVAPWDTTAPTMVDVVRTNNSKLTIAFSEDCSNLANANNGGFTVTETGSATTYAVTSTAMGADASHIVLTVANMLASAKEGVTVTYTAGGNGIIRDIAGNDLATDGVGFMVAPWDTTAPTITSSTLEPNNGYIDIVFGEGVFSADNGTSGLTAGSFVLWFTSEGGNATNATITSIKKNDNTVESLASSLVGGETTVRLFLSITGIPNGAEVIEIQSASGASIFDKAGNAVSALASTGSKQLNDKLAPTILSVVRVDNTHLLVTLSENCINLTKANNGGFTVNQTGNGTIIYAVTAINQGADASHVILTVADMGASAAAGVKVKYMVGTNGTIQDNVGNVLATPAAAFTVPAWG